MSSRASSCRKSSEGGLNAERRVNEGYVQTEKAGREQRAGAVRAHDTPGRGRPDGSAKENQGCGRWHEEDREPGPEGNPGQEGASQDDRRGAGRRDAEHHEEDRHNQEGGSRADGPAAGRHHQEDVDHEKEGRRGSGGRARAGRGRGGDPTEDRAQGDGCEAGNAAARGSDEAARDDGARRGTADRGGAAGRAEGWSEARDRRKALDGQLSRSPGASLPAGRPSHILPLLLIDSSSYRPHRARPSPASAARSAGPLDPRRPAAARIQDQATRRVRARSRQGSRRLMSGHARAARRSRALVERRSRRAQRGALTRARRP